MIQTKLSSTILATSLVLGLLLPSVALAAGPAPVNLLSSGNFVILSKTGITDIPSSNITGNIGTSPITGAAIGVTCAEVTGIVYTVDAAGPLPCRVINPILLTVAVSNMQTAYTNAAGRTGPTATELGAGNIGGLTIAPGLYKWSTGVTIPTNVTLAGGASDVWIFQIAGDLSIASGGSVPAGIKVILAGGAKASNIFWQVGGATGATLGTYSTFNGTILSAKQVILQTGAVLNGRALAQTQVTLDANVVSIPTSSSNNQLGEISGTKYEDTDGNGFVSVIDPKLSGWTIYLDTNSSGGFDVGEPSTITDISGNYNFSNLATGAYKVREVGQPGWIQTYPLNGSYTIVIAAGKISKNNNFGNFKLGSISGKKFNDANGNGKKDSGEVGLSSWMINLTKVGSPLVIVSALTNGSGNYSFNGLGSGIYRVREVAQTGWFQTTGNPMDIKVRSGAVSINNNFGNHFGQVKKGW